MIRPTAAAEPFMYVSSSSREPMRTRGLQSTRIASM